MVHVWTIEIGGVAVNYEQIDFDRSLSTDPTEFTATVEYSSSIVYWATVAIKNNGTVEWYGYVEDIKPIWTKDGIRLKLWGRDRLVILWKKQTERFSDSRLSGFFGSVDPAKLIQFLLRCPVSDDPTTSDLSKIGWGLDPSNWAFSATRTSNGYEPEWVAMRRQGLAWQLGPLYDNGQVKVTSFSADTDQWDATGGVKGTILDDGNYTTYIQDMEYSLLTVDANSGQPDATVADASIFSEGETVRITEGASTGVHGGVHETATIDSIAGNVLTFTGNLANTYNVADDAGVHKMTGITDDNYVMDDLSHTYGTITACYVDLIGRHVRNSWGSGSYPDATVRIYVYDGSSWNNAGTVSWTDLEYGYNGWATIMKSLDVSSILDTFAKVNSAKIRLVNDTTDATQAMARISEIRLRVTGYSYQTSGDSFTVDFGTTKDRVTGIYFESRKSISKFPVNYKVQTSTNGADWNDEVTVTSNTIRDVVESWPPRDSVRYVRIYITSNAAYGWEISQIYIYQADNSQYRVLNE